MLTVCSKKGGECCSIILISLGDAYPPVLSFCSTRSFPCPTLSPPSLAHTYFLLNTWILLLKSHHMFLAVRLFTPHKNLSPLYIKSNKFMALLPPLPLHLAYPLVFPQLHNNQSIVIVRAFTPQRSITP